MSSLHQPAALLTAQRRETLARRVRFLVTFTVLYNVVEGIVALAAGSVADSTALIGFGLDSFIEVSSALAVAWQFSSRDYAVQQAREQRALRVIAWSFFALAVYITVESVRSWVGAGQAQHSTVGIVLAAVSVLIMPVVSVVQRRVGTELGSRTAVADSKQTLLCTYMSAVLLVGLVAHSVFGWWWADPVAGLAIAFIAAREGISAWRGDACGCGSMELAYQGTDSPNACPSDEGCC